MDSNQKSRKFPQKPQALKFSIAYFMMVKGEIYMNSAVILKYEWYLPPEDISSMKHNDVEIFDSPRSSRIGLISIRIVKRSKHGCVLIRWPIAAHLMTILTEISASLTFNPDTLAFDFKIPRFHKVMLSITDTLKLPPVFTLNCLRAGGASNDQLLDITF